MDEAAMNPAAMTAEQAAALLQVDVQVVRRHLADGLPVDGAGRIHLVEYTAWLLGRLGGRTD
jgi:predicted ArsR family transcriptional regulator